MAERPRTYTYDPPGGSPRTNTVLTPHRVEIQDLRPDADTYQLDTHGFAVVRHKSAVQDFGTRMTSAGSITRNQNG